MTDSEAQGANICHLQPCMAATLVCFMHGDSASPCLHCVASALHMSIIVNTLLGQEQLRFYLSSMQKQLCEMMVHVCMCV